VAAGPRPRPRGDPRGPAARKRFATSRVVGHRPSTRRGVPGRAWSRGGRYSGPEWRWRRRSRGVQRLLEHGVRSAQSSGGFHFSEHRRVWKRAGEHEEQGAHHHDWQPAGEHTGKGYTTFCLDITHLLRFGGRNTIAVKVDNSFDERILPRGRSNSVYTADKLMVAAAGCRVPTLWRRLTPGTLKCRSVDLKLPALPESERIVRAARLYREALELIETRPDSAYHLLISVAETLSNLVVNELERDLGKMNLQLIANEENQDRAQSDYLKRAWPSAARTPGKIPSSPSRQRDRQRCARDLRSGR